MNKSDRTDKIEAWLLGKLPPVEATQMEKMVAGDSELAREVSLHKLALQAGKNLSDQHLKSQVLQWLNVEAVPEQPEDAGKSTTTSTNYQKWITGFLLIAILALLGYIWFQNRARADEKSVQMALAAENEELKNELESRQPAVPEPDTTTSAGTKSVVPEPVQPAPVTKPLAFYKAPNDWNTTMRSGDAPASTAEFLTAGVNAFQSGKNVTAERKAKSVLANDPNNREAHRLLAHALIRQGNYLEASHEFNWLITAFPAKKEEAEWNLLLCYKALSGTEEGNRLYSKTLKQILDNQNHSFYKQAKTLHRK